MRIAKTLFARAAGAAILVLLALPSLASANPGTGPELVQRSGRLVVLHADRAGGSSTQQWMLVNRRRRVRVRAPGDVWIDPGTPVRLEGTMHDGSLVLADSLTAVKRTGLSPLQADAAALAAAPSNENTIVLLVSFSGGPAFTNPTPSEATSLMFDQPAGGLPHSADSLDAYYQEQTYGQIAFSGTVVSVTIPGPASLCGSSSPYYAAEFGDTLYTWLDDAEDAAPGIEPSDDSAYKHVILALPAGITCDEVAGAAGLAEVGGNHVWINDAFELPVLAHELGHNLGLSHAGGLKCTNAGSAAPMGDSCSAQTFEYSDPFDAMGNAPVLRQMNMEHKLALDLLPLSAVQVVGVSGTYHVAPMETLTGSVELLRLPKPGGGSYFVEYRSPFAGQHFDNQPPGFAGVYIRTESPEPGNYPNRSDTALIDVHANTAGQWADARMLSGEVFDDPLRGITIQSGAQDANGATLAITMPVDTSPPGRPGRLSAVVSGSSVSLQWTPAGDDFGVVSYSVARDGAPLGLTAGTDFSDSGLVPGSTVTYAVTAADAAGNVGAAATMSVTLPDTVPPGAAAGVTATVSRDGHVHIAWTAATDNVGVVSYRVLRDGTGIGQPTGTAYVDTAPRPGSGATVTYSVVAFDLVGNAGPPAGAKPVRAALLRKLGASRLKVAHARARKLVRVTGMLSDAKAVCRLRLGRGAWHACKVAAKGTFSVKVHGKAAKLATLSLRDELGRVRQQTLHVP